MFIYRKSRLARQGCYSGGMLRSLLKQRTRILITRMWVSKDLLDGAVGKRLGSGLQADVRRHPHRIAGGLC